MKSFRHWIIAEGMGAQEYDPSSLSVKQLLYDFYTLGVLIGQQGGVGSDREKDLTWNAQYAWGKLIPFLRNHLLEKVMNSLLSEMKHYSYDQPEVITRKLSGNPGIDKRLNMPWPQLKAIAQQIEEFTGNFSRYQWKNKLNKSYHDEPPLSLGEWEHPSFEEFARLCPIMEYLFREPNRWSGGYGGDLWADGADGWLKLYQNTGQAPVWIDHIYDLEHNNGQLLDKNPEYRGYWLKQALDHKRDAKETLSLAAGASPFVRTLARRSSIMTDRKGEDQMGKPQTPAQPTTPPKTFNPDSSWDDYLSSISGVNQEFEDEDFQVPAYDEPGQTPTATASAAGVQVPDSSGTLPDLQAKVVDAKRQVETIISDKLLDLEKGYQRPEVLALWSNLYDLLEYLGGNKSVHLNLKPVSGFPDAQKMNSYGSLLNTLGQTLMATKSNATKPGVVLTLSQWEDFTYNWLYFISVAQDYARLAPAAGNF